MEQKSYTSTVNALVLVDLEFNPNCRKAIEDTNQMEKCRAEANALLESMGQAPVSEEELRTANGIRAKGYVPVRYTVTKKNGGSAFWEKDGDYDVEIDDARIRDVDQKFRTFEGNVRSVYDSLKDGPFDIYILREAEPSPRAILKKDFGRAIG